MQEPGEGEGKEVAKRRNKNQKKYAMTHLDSGFLESGLERELFDACAFLEK
jgi:hypothetical protein